MTNFSLERLEEKYMISFGAIMLIGMFNNLKFLYWTIWFICSYIILFFSLASFMLNFPMPVGVHSLDPESWENLRVLGYTFIS